MDRHQVRYALLKITALVLLGSTWVFWSFVYATRPEQVAPKNPLDALIRLPASLPAQLVAPAVKVMKPVEMEVMKVACWDVQDAAERGTDARWIRLTGRACQSDYGVDKISLRNVSNGYVATIFDDEKGLLTTDYIPLQMGKNDLVIRFESGPGVSSEQSVTLVRKVE